MDEIFNQELNARIFTHKTAIVGGVLMRKFVDNQTSTNGINLPEPILRQQAHEYVESTLAQAMATGTLNSLYEQLWEEIKDTLPEHTNVMVEAAQET